MKTGVQLGLRDISRHSFLIDYSERNVYIWCRDRVGEPPRGGEFLVDSVIRM